MPFSMHVPPTVFFLSCPTLAGASAWAHGQMGTVILSEGQDWEREISLLADSWERGLVVRVEPVVIPASYRVFSKKLVKPTIGEKEQEFLSLLNCSPLPAITQLWKHVPLAYTCMKCLRSISSRIRLQSVIYIRAVLFFFSTQNLRGKYGSLPNTAASPPPPSRHNYLKHTTWSSLFNCLISLHSTTDRLFIFIFSMNKSFNYYQTLFFSSTDGKTIFLPIWKRKLQDAVGVS